VFPSKIDTPGRLAKSLASFEDELLVRTRTLYLESVARACDQISSCCDLVYIFNVPLTTGTPWAPVPPMTNTVFFIVQ
jgi:hypothetical protein